jgi:hypothetical protein
MQSKIEKTKSPKIFLKKIFKVLTSSVCICLSGYGFRFEVRSSKLFGSEPKDKD